MQYQFMKLTPVGQIGAGRVVPFIRPTPKSVVVPVPSNIVHLNPITFTVSGDSFIDEGIRDGAIMIARQTFNLAEITPGRLCVVRIAGSDDIMKRVYIENDVVLLRSANPYYEDMIYSVEFIEVVALVEGEYTPRR